MSPAERALQILVFGSAVVTFWYGFVPATLGTIEWVFDIGNVRRRPR
jgi:hypothetical protein